MELCPESRSEELGAWSGWIPAQNPPVKGGGVVRVEAHLEFPSERGRGVVRG